MTHHTLDDPVVHNRWHPDIAPAVHVRSGDTVEMDTRDALDGQIDRSTTVADMAGFQLGRVHPLTGPVHVEGAEPGDLLAVRIDRIVPDTFGFTATFPGRGLMPELFPGPILALWEVADGFATSEQAPGVAIPGAPFMGTIGVAPSRDRLLAVNAREHRVAQRGHLVMPPRVDGALPADPAIAAEAWRTSAGHEVGGNMDIRQLVQGSTVYFPVDVPGALFSVGDGHFAQGDGETCGTAIEMRTRLTVTFELLAGEARRRGRTQPTFAVPPGPPSTSDWFGATGLSIDADGEVSFLDASLAARNALVAMVDALTLDHGLTREQAYVVASVAGDLRISSIVNVPHAQVSMFVPTDVFTTRGGS